jgi:two-component system chemotaxis response regulator CheY
MTQVLVIDDSTTCRLYYREMLEAAGFGVAEAINGLDGLEQAMGAPFDLALLDINMPLMDGMACLAALRREPGCRGLPVIVISTEAAAADRARAAGANAHFLKPIDPTALVAVARAMTGHANLRSVA